MSVKVDKSGRRSIQVEVEVPGTPEQVWQAIATGRGVSSWFVPTEITGQEGGVVTSNFGPGMEGRATITAWEPPRRFSAESDGLGPDAPALATEWHVEALSGGICTVRVVHSLFTDSDEWDDQLESIESGWPVFFETLRLYVAHFRGQACSNIQLLEVCSQSKSEAWDSMIEGLGFTAGKEGDSWRTPSGTPSISGKIQRIGESNDHLYALALVDQPFPAIISLIIVDAGGKGCVQLSLYCYGERGAEVVKTEEARWQSWVHERLSAVSAEPASS
jgi:uncharacterized protein YndB with AHSA1/START domain